MSYLKNVASGGQFYSEMAALSRQVEVGSGNFVTIIDGGETTSDSGYVGDPYMMLGIDENRDGVIDGGGYRMDPDGFHILSDLTVSGSINYTGDMMSSGAWVNINDNVWILKDGANETDLENVLNEISGNGGGTLFLPPTQINVTVHKVIPENTSVYDGNLRLEAYIEMKDRSSLNGVIIDVNNLSGAPIYMTGWYASVRNCRIFVNTSMPTASTWLYVVHMAGYRQSVIGNFVINNVTHTGNCVLISAASNNQVIANNVIKDDSGSDSAYAGIRCAGGCNLSTVTGNTVENGKYGIMLYGRKITCTGNQVYSTSQCGIWVYVSDAYNTVVGNVVYTGGGNRINPYNSSKFVINDNVLDGGVNVTGTCTNFTIIGNSMDGAAAISTSSSGYKVAHNLGDSEHDI